MRFETKYVDGTTRGTGDNYRGIERDVLIPDHGSISLQLGDGTWLNFKTSEWLTVSASNEPEGWDMEGRPPPPDLDFCGKCHEHTGFEWDGEDWISECCGVQPVEQP